MKGGEVTLNLFWSRQEESLGQRELKAMSLFPLVAGNQGDKGQWSLGYLLGHALGPPVPPPGKLSLLAGLENALGNWHFQLYTQGKSPYGLTVITAATCLLTASLTQKGSAS